MVLEKPMMARLDGRSAEQIRPITIIPSIYPQAAGSVLFRLGTTHVLAAVTLVSGVPPFLKNSGKGWLTAEYAMLPAATALRSTRESMACKRNGRSIEIARIIGRSLRSVVDLTTIGEKTIVVDCDVLNADGGTRVASLCAAQLALLLAQKQWLATGLLAAPIIREELAAIAVGVAQSGEILVDLTAAEDNAIVADYNFVLTAAGSIIEVQGTAEQRPITWAECEQLQCAAQEAVQQIISSYRTIVA
ncbi:ribonuclease PH [Candidatus Dependentiae bacterium]|nr:ribonuclease PH [Candidatus Dependentiae bacterium]